MPETASFFPCLGVNLNFFFVIVSFFLSLFSSQPKGPARGEIWFESVCVCVCVRERVCVTVSVISLLAFTFQKNRETVG